MFRIDRVQLVTVPTADQERSLEFYRALGFEVRADFPWDDGHRWMEVYPAGAPTGLALVPAGPDPVGLRTGVILNVPDIDAAHAHLAGLGVDVDPAVARAGSPARVRIGAVPDARDVRTGGSHRQPAAHDGSRPARRGRGGHRQAR